MKITTCLVLLFAILTTLIYAQYNSHFNDGALNPARYNGRIILCRMEFTKGVLKDSASKYLICYDPWSPQINH